MKKTILILLAGFILFTFASCDDGADNSPLPDTRAPVITSVSADKTTLDLAEGETSVTLHGVATSADGSPIKSYEWKAVSPPALPEGAAIDNTVGGLAANVTGLNVAGTYKFELEVTGSNDVKATSSLVEVVVLADLREPVITSKGATPSSITVPATTSIELNCSAISADDSAIKSVQWSVESAPAGASPIIADASLAATGVTGMTVAGEYKFRLIVTGNNNITKTEYVTVNAGLYAEVEFPILISGPAIDFSPEDFLPAGVTYILTDDRPTPNTWNSATGFDGVIAAEDYYEDVNDDIEFTQTFYLNGIEITGPNSRRIVAVNVFTFGITEFGVIDSQTRSVTLQHP